MVSVNGGNHQDHDDSQISTGPFNAIHVGAAAPTLPAQLVRQLASPGRMFVPVGTVMQQIMQIDKDENGRVTKKELMPVSVRRTVGLRAIANT